MNDVAADERAIRRVQEGDTDAFEHLVNRHHRLVYAICLARLGQVEPAEDLAQEVFLRAFLNLSKLQKPESFGPWVARMARNLGANWIRGNVRASRLLPMVDLEDDAVEAIPDKVPSPREAIQDRERNAQVQEAILRLGPDEREAVLLHYMEGMTKKEIAGHLGVHPSTVGRSLDRSMTALRGTLDESLRVAAEGLKPRQRMPRETMRYVCAAAVLSGPAREALLGAASTTASAGSAKAGGGSAGFLVLLWQKLQALLAAGGAGLGTTKGIIAVSAIAAAGGGTYVYQRAAAARHVVIPSDALTAILDNQAGKESIAIPTIYDGSFRGWRVRSFSQVQENGRWVSEGVTMTTRVDIQRADPNAGATGLFTIEEFDLPRNHEDRALVDTMTGYQFQADCRPNGSFTTTRPVTPVSITPEMTKYIGHALRADITSVATIPNWNLGQVIEDAVQVEMPGFEGAMMNVESRTTYLGRALAEGNEVLLVVSDINGNLAAPFTLTTMQAVDARIDVILDGFDFTGRVTYALDPQTHRINAADHSITTTNIASRLVRHVPGQAPIEQAYPAPDEITREVLRVEYF